MLSFGGSSARIQKLNSSPHKKVIQRQTGTITDTQAVDRTDA